MSPEDSKPSVAWVRLSNLLWVPILGLAWAAMTVWGTPHLRVSYTWNGRDAAPYYHACEYWGISSFRIRPADGKCPLLVLARSASGR
jgi:hypothetical protein